MPNRENNNAGDGVCGVPGCARGVFGFDVCIEHRIEETAALPHELDAAVAEIRAQARMEEEARARLAEAQIRANPAPAGGSRYGEVALQRTCEEIAGMTEGSRNMALSRAAYRIGGLVGSGHIGAKQASSGLMRAGEACGLPRDEASSVVKRGLRAGAEKPWAPNSSSGFSTSQAWGGGW